MENNLVTLEFEALPQNQSFARSVVSAYCAASDPTVEELTEIKTAVSEAVSNAIIHGYERKGKGKIRMELSFIDRDKISVKVIIMTSLYLSYKKQLKTLLITNDSDWLNQAREEFKQYLQGDSIRFFTIGILHTVDVSVIPIAYTCIHF